MLDASLMVKICFTTRFSSYCTSHLLTHFHQEDACTAQWNDIKTAFKAKATSDPDEAQKLIATTYYKQNLGSDLSVSPTAGAIWDLKEKPGWDTEEAE